MLPLSIQNRFKNPGALEKHFIAYLQKAGLEISNSKTISSQALYHQVNVGGSLVNTFFTGTLTTGETNIEGSFVRPQSEHFVIYGIRIFEGIDSSVIDTNWVAGITTAEIENGNFTITNNSEVELKNYPMTEALAGLTTKDQGLILLDQPIIWAGQTSLSLVFSMFSTPGSADANVRIQLLGMGLI